jgi:uncharacterized protein
MADPATRRMGAAPSAAPVAPRERIAAIDIVRGFALLGILAVNMALFANPIYSVLGGHGPWTGPLDRAAAWLIRFLAESKFYTLFSFLFGLGLVLQMQRAAARGVPFVPVYARRLLILLVIGLIHAYLIWIGDILVSYALLGFVLLLFRRRSPRALLIWAAVLISLPVLLSAASVALLEMGRSDPTIAAQIDRSFAEQAADWAARAETAARVYAGGDVFAITAQRARDLAFFYPYTLFILPSVLAMFLVGLWVGQRGIAQDIPGHLPFIRRVAAWGLGLGLPLNLLYAVMSEISDRTIPTVPALVAALASSIGAPILSMGYAASLTLLAHRGDWGRRLAPLAPVGRMALSNYLAQSLVCTTIFYGYGLGLFGRVGPAAGLLLTIAIFLLQIPISVWWLRRFRFGPVEWLWRSLTYGRPQPMRAEAQGTS